MTDSPHSADSRPEPAAELPEGAREVYAEAEAPDTDAAEEHHPPHPPGTRSPEDYTDPPGHHRRGGSGPALDVGA
jgi:hypothetical protein